MQSVLQAMLPYIKIPDIQYHAGFESTCVCVIRSHCQSTANISTRHVCVWVWVASDCTPHTTQQQPIFHAGVFAAFFIVLSPGCVDVCVCVWISGQCLFRTHAESRTGSVGELSKAGRPKLPVRLHMWCCTQRAFQTKMSVQPPPSPPPPPPPPMQQQQEREKKNENQVFVHCANDL